jgi:hypothetical protein
MEQDEVGLDAQVVELTDAVLQVPEERGIESGEIPVVRRPAVEGVELRLVGVVHEVLGEDAHADLVEGRPGQGAEGAFGQVVALVGPGVGGGDGDPQCTVLAPK